ncbi:hypothetical protein [Streptomyces virginiae]|uniref:hypothetical protein n=1 Tax=Streptomyces virginiae TaxID=1961 RepID=UPI0036578EF3
MSLIPPSVLPLVPSAFATGDRITHSACVVERVAVDRWLCVECGSTDATITDRQAREYFTDPACLAALGAPLFSPAHVPADAPLPGRPVAEGECPYVAGTPYLMCGTNNVSAPYMEAVPYLEGGPWGTAQKAFTAKNSRYGGDNFELSLTETGTVYLRVIGSPETYAYVPAEYLTEEETVEVLSWAVWEAAFPYDVVVVDLS